MEARLAQQKQHIDNLTRQLNAMIELYNKTPKSQQMSQISLLYDVAFARNKIAYYERMRGQLEAEESRKRPFNYDIFFSHLDDSFGRAKGRLDDIDELLGNFTRRRSLREKVVNVKNNL